MTAAYQTLVAAFLLLKQTGALEPEPPFKALGQLTGTDTAIESPSVRLIQDEASWVDLWKEHRAEFELNVPPNANPVLNQERPKVDFRDSVIVCMFGGKSTNIGGFEVAATGNGKEDDVFLKVRPQLLPLTGANLLQNPYLFVIVPRTTHKMVVELDQTALGGSGWRVLATLPATKRENKG